MTVNVYEQYFGARHTHNGVERRAALVMLTSDSGGGEIRYTCAVSFFPHEDEEDFAVSYDDYYEKELYSGRGRRSKKREAAMLETLRVEIDALAAQAGGVVDWNAPLRPERRG